MPNPTSHVIRTTRFNHKGVPYDVAMLQDPADLMTYHVDVTLGPNPVVVTYPDGHRAMLGYSVSLATRLGMLRSLGIDPLPQLAAVAEADIRRLI